MIDSVVKSQASHMLADAKRVCKLSKVSESYTHDFTVCSMMTALMMELVDHEKKDNTRLATDNKHTVEFYTELCSVICFLLTYPGYEISMDMQMESLQRVAEHLEKVAEGIRNGN